MKTPASTALIVLILGLGIGGATAVFSVVDSVLLKAMPFDEPEHLVGVWLTSPGDDIDWLEQSTATYFTIRDESQVFEDIAIWQPQSLSVRIGGGQAERVTGLYVTDGIFTVLRVGPILGRPFNAVDAREGSADVFMLGYEFWKERFDADPAVVGQPFAVNGTPGTIVGVMPAGLRIRGVTPAVFALARFTRARARIDDFSYRVIGRLKTGVSLEAAEAAMAPILARAAELYPGGMTLAQMDADGMAVRLRPFLDEVVGSAAELLWFLFGALVVVLLIACANVANLVLLRGQSRRRELAIRAALGAPRRALRRSVVLESLVLGLLGGMVGTALAYLGVRGLVRLAPGTLPRMDEIAVTTRAVWFALSASVVAGLLASLVPAVRLTSGTLTGHLRDADRSNSGGLDGTRVRAGLVGSQVALAAVLLVGCGLMWRSVQSLNAVHPGFTDGQDVLTFRVDVPPGFVASPEAVFAFHEEVIARLSALPGVDGVSGSSSLPMDHVSSGQSIFIEDRPTPENETPPQARIKWIAGNYFATLRTPILFGRGLTWQDARTRARVVVVNEHYARHFWGDPAKALGRRVQYCCGDWHEIVGVVADPHDNGVDRAAVDLIYWPLAVDGFWDATPWVPRWFAYVVRSSHGDPMSLVPAARSVVAAVNGSVPVFAVRTLEQLAEQSRSRTVYGLTLLSVATAIAIILALTGVYGAVAVSVSRRTREIGIRVALGAARRDVWTVVLRHSLSMVATGLAAGLGLAAALSRSMASLVFGVRLLDLPSFGLAIVGIGLVALLASAMPLWRAARVDPVVALRSE